MFVCVCARVVCVCIVRMFKYSIVESRECICRYSLTSKYKLYRFISSYTPGGIASCLHR